VTVELRTAEEVDCAGVGALHFRSRAAAYAHLLPPAALAAGSAAAYGEWWAERRRWERGTHRLTVAVAGGALAGFTYLGPGDTAGVAELCAIHVDPDRVGGGIGRLLMADAVAQLAAYGSRAVLWVLAGNGRARRFYQRGGWRFDGTTRDEPMGGEPTHQLRYARELGGGA
jgi:GNAT superfamily N-acetyltransferase